MILRTLKILFFKIFRMVASKPTQINTNIEINYKTLNALSLILKS